MKVFDSTPVVNFIKSTFYAQILRTKVFSTAFFYLLVTRERLPKRHSYKKCVLKMLMKLTPSYFDRYTDQVIAEIGGTPSTSSWYPGVPWHPGWE